MVYGRDSTYIFTRAPVQIGISYCHLHGCSYHFYGRGPVLRHQEGERERTGYDKYRIQEDLRQGEEIFLSLHGDGLHRPDSLYGSPLPCLLYDLGRLLRVL